MRWLKNEFRTTEPRHWTSIIWGTIYGPNVASNQGGARMNDIYDRYDMAMEDDEDSPENAAEQAFMVGWLAADPFD